MVHENHEPFINTWGMMFSVRSVESFRPFMHKGQFSVIKGRWQEFDTTFLPQYLTDANLIGWTLKYGVFFHFRLLIATYRNFLNEKRLESIYELKRFLIRILIEVFWYIGVTLLINSWAQWISCRKVWFICSSIPSRWAPTYTHVQGDLRIFIHAKIFG